MNKSKLLVISVIILMILNITLLFFMMRKGHGHRGHRGHRGQGGGHHNGPKMIIIERLGFDELQAEAYDGLIGLHIESVGAKEKELFEAKELLYRGLMENTEAENDVLMSRLAAVQADIERIHLDHFKAIGEICNPEQSADYQALTHDMARLFSPKHQKGKKGKKHGHRR